MLHRPPEGADFHVLVDAPAGKPQKLFAIRPGHVHVDVVVPGNVSPVTHRPQQGSPGKVIPQVMLLTKLHQRVQQTQLHPANFFKGHFPAHGPPILKCFDHGALLIVIHPIL